MNEMKKVALENMESKLAELRTIDEKWILKVTTKPEDMEVWARFNQICGMASGFEKIGLITWSEFNDLIWKYTA